VRDCPTVVATDQRLRVEESATDAGSQPAEQPVEATSVPMAQSVASPAMPVAPPQPPEQQVASMAAAVEAKSGTEVVEPAASADARTRPNHDATAIDTPAPRRKPLLLSAAAARQKKQDANREAQDGHPREAVKGTGSVKLSARSEALTRRRKMRSSGDGVERMDRRSTEEHFEEPQCTLRRRRKVRRTATQEGDGIEGEQGADAPATTQRRRRKVRRVLDADEERVSRLRGLIRGVYERNNPAKLPQLDEHLWTKYVGVEHDVYLHICKKYGEPPDPYVAQAHKSPGKIVLQPRGSRPKAAPKARAPKKPKLGVSELRSRIRSIYERHNPEKLVKINTLLEKYAGAELEMYEQACAKYGVEPLMEATPEEITVRRGGLVARKAAAPPPAALQATKGGAKSLDFLHREIEDAADTSVGGWPFVGDAFSANSSSESWGSDNEHHMPAQGVQKNPHVDIYGDLARHVPVRAGSDAAVGTAWGAEARRDPVTLETFLGDWRDSIGNNVSVRWAPSGSRGGPLDVHLSRSGGRSDFKLGIKTQSDGRFVCGHYVLM